MSILMTFALFAPAVQATSSPSVTVGNSMGKDGDTVQVAVSIQDNPGLIAMRLYVGYDASKLQLLDAQDQGIFGTANAYFGKDKTKNPYTLLWEDALAEENYTANGDLAVLTFKILDDAEPGESAITLTLDQGSTINVGVDNVPLQMINGSITIKGDEPPAVGTSTVTCASASAEAGDTVNIAVSIQNNPGLIAMRLYVSYDADKLQLLDAQDQGLFGSGNAYFGKVKTAIPYTLLWEDALAEENYTGNGTLAILSFKVLDDAQAGNTEIVLSLDQGSTINVDVENVSLQLVNGTVTITGGYEPPVVQTPTIALADVEANAGDTIEVPIYIQNNPGLIALKFSVSYDAEVLTLLSATDAGIFGSGNAYFGKRLTDIPYVLLWEDALADDNYQGNGLLATLTFKVADGAQTGETAVSISMDNGSTIDVVLTEIHFDVKGSTVSVTKTEVPPEPNPTIAVGTVVGRVGETVQVPITISDNPGLIGMKLMISYDPDILTLTDVTDGEIFGTNNAYFGNRLSEIPYTLMWEDSLTESNYTGNGTLAILTFTIAQDAYGQEAVITLQYNLGSSINVDLQEIPFTLENGKVSVVHKPPMENGLRIFSYDGDFEQQIDWWKKYSSATMTLGFLIYGCDDAVRYVWSTNSWRVDIDQRGNITNSGPFARSAKIRLRAYDRDDNIVAESSVTVRFYKFNWQYRRLQSQEIVSDNMFRPTVEPTATEPETLVSFVTAFFTKVFWWFVR